MSSFRPSTEKNAEDVKLADISAHTQPQTQLMTQIAEDLKQLAVNVRQTESISPSLTKLVQQVKEKDKNTILKQVIEDRIAIYPKGPLTLQEVMSANTRFKEDEDRMYTQQGKHRESKIQHQQHSVPDGQTTLWSYEESKRVTVAFEHAIIEKIFEECKTQHNAFGVE